MVRRMYSDKAAEDQKQEAASEASAPESAEAEDPVAKQLQEKDARIKDLTDDLLYCKAELQNVQRRTAEEKKTMGDHAISRLAKDLTESMYWTWPCGPCPSHCARRRARIMRLRVRS